MSISDNEFDIVICQHGLQYFPDRPAALKEMHRVLRVPGRLVLNVWRPIKFNVGHAVLADVLERHMNAKAASSWRVEISGNGSVYDRKKKTVIPTQ